MLGSTVLVVGWVLASVMLGADVITQQQAVLIAIAAAIVGAVTHAVTRKAAYRK